MLRYRRSLLLCAASRATAATHPLADPAALLRAATSAALAGDSDANPESHAATVLCKDYACARLITLNKPRSLNSTDLGMQCLLRRYIMEDRHPQDCGNAAWDQAFEEALSDNERSSFKSKSTSGERDKKGCVYILQGAGNKSFCAGGDVVALVQDKPAGTQFASNYLEYQLDYYLWAMTHQNTLQGAKSLKQTSHPHQQQHEHSNKTVFVALWNGYVMGGGAGLSVHGHYRIASTNTVFAMPECGIGLFPDVGASYFLPRFDVPSEYNSRPSTPPGESTKSGVPGLGLYLGLTAARLTGPDLVLCGIATHFLESPASFPALAEALAAVSSPADVATVLREHCLTREDFLSRQQQQQQSHTGGSLLAPSLKPEHLAVIAECFTLHPDAVRNHNARVSQHLLHASHGSEDNGKRDGDTPVVSTPQRPITAVESVEEVVARLHALHARESGAMGGNKSAAAFSERVLAQMWPALTGKPLTPRLDDAVDSENSETSRRKERPLPSLSPTSLKLTFDMQRLSMAERGLAPALAREYAAILHACDGAAPKRSQTHRRGHHTDFIEGVDALLLRKRQGGPPVWSPPTLADVDVAVDIEAFYEPRVRHGGLQQPNWDPYTPFQQHKLV